MPQPHSLRPRVWEQHCCLPLLPTADILELARYPVGSYLSVNVGYSQQSTADTLALLHQFRRDALAHGGFRLVERFADIEDEGRIALAFDLEDANPLGGDLDTVKVFYDLGLRSLAATYNYANAAGCGCLDTEDTGLTGYGRDLVRQLNAVGVFADGSHCSRRTGLDIAETTAVPMIYSHSNFDALWEHPRNITDDQARACAATGGVIGINGVGIFLGHNAPGERAERVEAMADHIAYGAELVGIEHVGVSSDFSFDGDQFNAEIAATPEAFSDFYTRWGPLQWTPPEDLFGENEIPGLAEVLARRGFSAAEIAAVFRGNFTRVARQVWRD
ncbi:dipeptidase [Nocardia acididurans]|uniref:dipeptidase n=1 Tax=Nocardia acididurans TaxID=2802282 RepID=UPI001E512A67|nr:membrane dipeptidase [Nocardia acididurans]